MKIVTLIENLVYQSELVAEHGLSIYFETENKKILFDTGQSGMFMQNAHELSIDIEEIDTVILSHGHYDHTGGLYPFLKSNSKAKIYTKNELFIPKYHGQSCFIGIKKNESLLKDRLVYIDDIIEIDQHVFIMPEIKIYDPVDTHFDGLNIKQGDELKTDEFADELFIVIKNSEQINIITACSHRGITNICTTATAYFKLPVGLILGGFHMKECTSQQYIKITHFFRQLRPKSIGVCHCTGVDKFANMRHECDGHVFYNFTGNIISL